MARKAILSLLVVAALTGVAEAGDNEPLETTVSQLLAAYQSAGHEAIADGTARDLVRPP